MICPNCGSKMDQLFRTWKCYKNCKPKTRLNKVKYLPKEVETHIINSGFAVPYFIEEEKYILDTTAYDSADSYSIGTLVTLDSNDTWCEFLVSSKLKEAYGKVTKPPTVSDINMWIELFFEKEKN